MYIQMTSFTVYSYPSCDSYTVGSLGAVSCVVTVTVIGIAAACKKKRDKDTSTSEFLLSTSMCI